MPTFHDSGNELRKLGLSANAIRSQLALSLQGHGKTHSADAKDVIRRTYQKTVRMAIHNTQRPPHIPRLRHKLERWALPGFPNHNAERTHRALTPPSQPWPPPRVSAATLRTIFNGWTTKRRFQAYAKCQFGCSGWHHEDSLEHYARCPVIHELRYKRLNLRIQPWTTAIFLALHLPHDHNDDTTLTKVALLIYATYKTYNTIRHDNTAHRDKGFILDLMDQHTVEGAFGHPKATKVLDTAYVRTTRPNNHKPPQQDQHTFPLDDLNDLAIFDMN